MGERYYSFAFMSLFTDNFAYVCRRLDGGRPAPRMIVGPAWEGIAPSGVVLVRAPTNGVWLLGRILVDGPDDLPAVRALQGKTLLETPDMRNERRILETEELMRQRSTLPPQAVADWSAPNRADPFDLFAVGLRALGESPLGERDGAVMESFADLKLRPGRKFDARAFSESERMAIQAGIAEAEAEIRAAGKRYGQTSAMTISTAPWWHSPGSPRSRPPRRPISPVIRTKVAGRSKASAATCCASSRGSCRRPRRSGR